MVYPEILNQVTKPSLFDRKTDQAYMVYPEILKQTAKLLYLTAKLTIIGLYGLS